MDGDTTIPGPEGSGPAEGFGCAASFRRIPHDGMFETEGACLKRRELLRPGEEPLLLSQSRYTPRNDPAG